MMKRPVQGSRGRDTHQRTYRDHYRALGGTRSNLVDWNASDPKMPGRRSPGGGGQVRAELDVRTAGTVARPGGRSISEHQDVESVAKATAESFVAFYNQRHGSRYELAESQTSYGRCVDRNTLNLLNLEICVFDDALREECQHARVLLGRPALGARGVGDATEQIVEALARAVDTPPQLDTALVVRQLTGVWSREEWASHLSQIPWSRIGFKASTFDRGIWVHATSSGESLRGGACFFRVDPYRPGEHRQRTTRMGRRRHGQ